MMTFVTLSNQGQVISANFSDADIQRHINDHNNAIWVEISNPTLLEREFIQEQEKIQLPEHHELHQMEYSNQFYHEDDCIFLTANLVTNSYPKLESHAISIIVTKNKIITVRYSEPNPVKKFLEQLIIKPRVFHTQYDLLKILLQYIIGKNADVLEATAERASYLSMNLSKGMQKISVKNREKMLNNTLLEINVLEDLSSMTYQSLSSLDLLINYLEQKVTLNIVDLKSLKQDIMSLLKHANYLNQKINFQLNATLGVINIEQIGIVKIFTVLALVFMPPTLIASIEGMNFKHMPELELIYSYPIALCAIVLSAYFPWLIFRKKGWI